MNKDFTAHANFDYKIALDTNALPKPATGTCTWTSTIKDGTTAYVSLSSYGTAEGAELLPGHVFDGNLQLDVEGGLDVHYQTYTGSVTLSVVEQL